MDKVKLLKIAEALTAVAFGLAYWLYDLKIATAVLIVAMTVFVCFVKFMGEKLTKLQLISWLAILILGGASVLSKDESIIKWKPSVISWIISISFLATQFVGKKSLVERLIADKVPAPVFMLRNVNLATALFFLSSGLLNIIVAMNFTTTVWVNFKLFGLTVLNLVFVSSCLFYLRAYLHNIFPPDASGNK
jgi:intracellular septation protein